MIGGYKLNAPKGYARFKEMIINVSLSNLKIKYKHFQDILVINIILSFIF